MARIPDAIVERLKGEVSLERLAEARGVELKRHGADLIGRCPFHEDRTPSLVITPAKNLWCVFRRCRPVIPAEAGHGFRRMSAGVARVV